jgi:hypothetical protein
MPVWIGVVFAALISAFFLRELKISEFRQAWINELRGDIAYYVSICLQIKSIESMIPKAGDAKERETLRGKADALKIEASTNLYKIRLRFNPRVNAVKDDDDKFLKELEELLLVIKTTPTEIDYATLNTKGDSVIESGREILKREWEETKKPWLIWLRDIKKIIASLKRQF